MTADCGHPAGDITWTCPACPRIRCHTCRDQPCPCTNPTRESA